MSDPILIVGAGHAGGTAAALLRQYGYVGSITVIGDEPLYPYQRPPLSKAWLYGEANGDSLALREPGFYAAENINVLTETSVSSIDPIARLLHIESSQTMSYGKLILATGARPLRPDFGGATHRDVHVLRSAADAERLKNALEPGKRIAVIGGGYIGLEVAASAVKLGGSAVIVERELRLLARSGGEVVAEFFLRLHRENGVDVHLGATVSEICLEHDRLVGVHLASGELLACDIVLMGVGITPNDELARAAGLNCERGIVVDADARTSHPDIFAIGDCTLRRSDLYGRFVAPESVPNALEQAKLAAAAIAGRPRPAPEVPWNWSDQYNRKLQIAGLALEVDNTVVRGDPSSDGFAVFHLKGRCIQQVEAINRPPEFMVGKQLIGKRREIDVVKLADAAVSMRDVGL